MNSTVPKRKMRTAANQFAKVFESGRSEIELNAQSRKLAAGSEREVFTAELGNTWNFQVADAVFENATAVVKCHAAFGYRPTQCGPDQAPESPTRNLPVRNTADKR